MFMETIDRISEPYRLTIESGYNRWVIKHFQGNRLKEEMTMYLAIKVGLYWTVGLLYLMLDPVQRPKLLLRYKVQPTSQVNRNTLRKGLRQVALNQMIGAGLQFFYTSLKLLFEWEQPNIPTLSRFLLEWIIFFGSREIAFYYTHRLLHHPLIYRYVHKRHHEWQTPIAIMGIYCHPIEHILSNIVPVVIGPSLVNSHRLTFYLWMAYIMLLTLNDHSGFHFPGFSSPLHHDFHHLKFNCNYGVLGLLDWLHGTDQPFRQSPHFSKHRIYFTFNPPKSIKSVQCSSSSSQTLISHRK